MSLSVHDALIRLMIVAASADHDITEVELDRIEGLIGRLPVFEGFDRSRLAEVANACADAMNDGAGLDGVIAEAIAALPPKLEDTAYALAVEVTAVDLLLEQEELRFLELMRDHMRLDRLTTAAIEVAARARLRKLPE